MPEMRENKPDTPPYIAQHFDEHCATDNKSANDIAQCNESQSEQWFERNSCGEISGVDFENVAQCNDKRKTHEVWLSQDRSAELCCIPLRTFQDQTSKGIYTARFAANDGRGKQEILLDSLPAQAQARYYIECRKVSGIGQPSPPLFVDMDEREALWEKFYSSSEKLQARAHNACAAVIEFNRLLDTGIGRMAAYEKIQDEYKASRNTLNGYLTTCERFDRMDWPARLLPTYTGKPARLEWHPGAWQFFLDHALTPRAKVDIAYRRTEEEGKRQGWPQLPNIKTARKAIKDLPQTVVTLVKEGPTALKRLAPTAMRDYSYFKLNEVWSPNGRKMDLAVVDTHGRYGEKGRLLRMQLYLFVDYRSRYPVGYAYSDTLNAELVRAAFINALKKTNRGVPKRLAPDNGRELTANEHSGGCAWMRRANKNYTGMIGTFPQLGIDIDWTKVAHGQSKPVERWFRTLSENFETLPEFRGAYLGSNASDRPEECERSRAIPLELFEKRLPEIIATIARTPHRGDSMDGKSPEQVYDELINEPGHEQRQITEVQRRMAALSRTEITIRSNGTFVIHGAVFYSMQTAEQIKGKGYWATYDPHDLAHPVTVYKTEDGKAKKIAENVPQIVRTPGNSKAAGKEISKAQATFNKSVKASAKALGVLQSAERGHITRQAAEKFPEVINKETGEILPMSKVVEMVQNKADPARQPTPSEADETARIMNLAKEIEEANNDEFRRQAARR